MARIPRCKQAGQSILWATRTEPTKLAKRLRAGRLPAKRLIGATLCGATTMREAPCVIGSRLSSTAMMTLLVVNRRSTSAAECTSRNAASFLRDSKSKRCTSRTPQDDHQSALQPGAASNYEHGKSAREPPYLTQPS